MATKTTFGPANVAAPEDASQDILLQIDGLIANDDGTFVLRGAKSVELNHRHFDSIEEALVQQGVPQNLALRLSEEAHNSIQTGLLADALAQRTRRIG